MMNRVKSFPWLPLGIFLLATAAMFGPYLFAHQTLFAGDTAFVFLPLRMYGARRLAAGHLPLWNPCIFGGVPYLADPQAQCFYPFQVLLSLLGTPRAIGWSIPLHAFLTCCAMYGFARRVLRLSPPAATLSGLLLGLGGQFQSKIAIPIYYVFFPWLPAMLWAMEAARARCTLVRWGVVSLLWGVAWSTMCYPYVFYLMFPLAMRAFSRDDPERTPPRRWPGDLPYLALWIGTMAIGVALAAVVLLPSAELARLSDRSFRPDYHFATSYSIKPLYLLSSLLFPTFYGSFQSRQVTDFAMAQFTTYSSMLGLILAGAAALSPGRHRWTSYFLVLSLGSCFFALGNYNPAYFFFYRYVPGFAMFRAPAGFLVLLAFSLSGLAGIGVHHLLSPAPEERLRLAKRAGVGGALGGLLMGGFLILAQPPRGMDSTPFYPEQIRQVLLLVLALLSLLLIYRPGRREGGWRGGRGVAGLWIAMAFLDLYLLGLKMEFQDTLPISQLRETPRSVQLFPLHVERRLTLGPSVPLKSFHLRGGLPEMSDREWRSRAARAVRELLSSTWAAAYDVNGLDGAWGALFPLKRKVPALYDNSPLSDKRPWLDLLGVRYLVSLQPAEIPNTQLMFAETPFVYWNEQAMNRAFLVHHAESWQPGGDTRSIFQQLVQTPGLFPPVSKVFVEGDVPAMVSPGTQPPIGEEVAIRKYSPEWIDLEVHTKWLGLVVISDPPYPGWRVWVDGREKSMLAVDYVLRGVVVESGRHQVRWIYHPTSVKFGLFVSLLMVGVLVGIFTMTRPSTFRRLKSPKVV